jgi:hypothetical protein
MLVAAVEEAWEKKWIMAALMMDIKGAFPTVNRACLLHKMRLAQIDENLVQWTESFMANWQVEITVNGDLGLAINTNTGLPQGSPVSPVLFLIYITNLASLVEATVDSAVALSFIDDITWIVDSTDDVDITGKLNRYTETCLAWAQDNAVRFEEDKTKAILCSWCQKHWQEPEVTILVGDHIAPYNMNVIQWLGY